MIQHSPRAAAPLQKGRGARPVRWHRRAWIVGLRSPEQRCAKIRSLCEERGHKGEHGSPRHTSEEAILDILAPLRRMPHEEEESS